MEILKASIIAAETHGYKELHAFIQDPKWSQILKKIGFIPTVGEALVIGTDYGKR
jgi:hypothetical protein